MKSSAYDTNPAAGLSLLISVIKSAILLQSVKQNVSLPLVLPCQSPINTPCSYSSFSPWFPLSWITTSVPPLTNCGALSGANCGAWCLAALSTASLSIEPYTFEMSPGISMLHCKPPTGPMLQAKTKTTQKALKKIKTMKPQKRQQQEFRSLSAAGRQTFF